jgi:hypothetical protein
MKNKILILLFLLFSKSLLFAQDYTTLEILNLETETARLTINQAFKDLKLPQMHIWKNQTSAESSFYTYTSLMIKNRFVFKVNIVTNKLTVSISNRQYQSNSHWVDNPLPMSKKQAAKILDPIKEKIIELNKNEIIANNRVNTTNEEPLESKKAVIYKDFAIIKTEDSIIDVLVINKNGNIIGCSIWENETNVKTLVYKENNDAEAITLEFDEKGLPTYMKIQNFAIKINANHSGELNLLMIDTLGNYISEQQLSIKAFPNKAQTDELYENNKGHGPFNSFELTSKDITFSDFLGYSSYALSQIANGLELKNGGKKVIIEFGKSLGIALEDPENKFFLNELSTCAQVLTTIAPFVKTAYGVTTTAAGVTAGAASISTLAAVGIIIGGAKISYDAAMRIKERHWPTPIFVINKPNEPLQTGSFGEERNSPGYITIEYNYTDKAIEIISEHPEELKLELYHIDHLNGYDKAYYNVFAKESEYKTHRITAYHIIYDGFLESKVLDPKTISKEIEITIKEPNYYYLPNCNDCSKDSSIKKKLEECKLKISNDGNIYFSLDEKNTILECNEKLNDERLRFIKSSTLDNKGFKPFVKESDCSFDCKNDNNSPKNSLENTNTISYSHLQAPIFIDEISSEDHFLDDRRDYNNTIENIKEDLSPTHNYIPIHLDKNGSFNGTFKENIYDLITEITISGNIDLKSKLGSISVTFKQTKNVRASPMNACDYDLEFSYTFNYKDLKLSFYNNTLPYTLKPNENSILTVSNYKFKEDTKCPKRNYSKEKIYKKINEEYLKERLASKNWSYFHININ